MKVLCIEDEADIARILELSLLRAGGFEVRTCLSGLEGIEAAAAFGPDLILLDVMMPGLDGPETLKRLRQQPATSATDVVFLTAKAMPRELARLKGLGALAVLIKPFDPRTLPEEVWSLSGRAPRHPSPAPPGPPRSPAGG